jgi:nitrite reductase (cytochrome c-552)
MKKYKILLAISLIAIGLMSVLVASINEKKEEQKQINSVPQMEKRWETKNEEFRKYYPRQFDSWKQTKNSDDMITEIH